MIKLSRLALVALCAFGCASTVVGEVAIEDAAPADVVIADTNPTDHADGASVEAGSDAVTVDVPEVAVDVIDVATDATTPGSLTVTLGNMRDSTILCPFTHEGWDDVAEYRTMPTGEARLIDYVRIASRGDAASFARVAIAYGGRVVGEATLPAGRNQQADVRIDPPLLLSADTVAALHVWVRLAPIVPYSSVAIHEGVPLSGALIALGIANGRQAMTELWDSPSYDGMWNIHSVGVISREPAYAPAPPPAPAYPSGLGNPFVVRRSKPTVTLVRPTSTDIPGAGALVDLLRFSTAADTAGPIAHRAFRVRVEIGHTTGSTLFLNQFQIYDGGRLMSSSEYNLVRLGTIIRELSAPYTLFTVEFIHERQIPAGGSSQMLFMARVQGDIRSGDAIRVSFLESDYPGPVTGQLAGEGDILTSDGMTVVSAFTWSDYSDSAHSDDARIMPSHDWTNAHGRLLRDLSSSVTLTVP